VAEIALITRGESLQTPRDNPLNLIRLGPAEGRWLANDYRHLQNRSKIVAARFGRDKARAQ